MERNGVPGAVAPSLMPHNCQTDRGEPFPAQRWGPGIGEQSIPGSAPPENQIGPGISYKGPTPFHGEGDNAALGCCVHSATPYSSQCPVTQMAPFLLGAKVKPWVSLRLGSNQVFLSTVTLDKFFFSSEPECPRLSLGTKAPYWQGYS